MSPRLKVAPRASKTLKLASPAQWLESGAATACFADPEAPPLCQHPGCWHVATHRGLRPSDFLCVLPYASLAIIREGEVLAVGEFSPAALEMILGAYEAQITGGRVSFPRQRREHPLVAWRDSAHGG